MKRVYISGGITGVENYKESFSKKQTELEKNGFEVINPALLGNIMPKSASWEEYMIICVDLLCMCDYICMLCGWEKSEGAKAELKFSALNNIPQLPF